MIFLIIWLRLFLSKPKSSIIVTIESEEDSKIPRALIDRFIKWTLIIIILIIIIGLTMIIIIIIQL